MSVGGALRRLTAIVLAAACLAGEAGADALFSPPDNFPAGNSPFAVALADLDGDRIIDIVSANSGIDHDVSVLLGNGDGSFAAAVSFAVGSIPHTVAVADFDGDGVPDLVAANLGSADVSVLLGNGDGGFGAAASFAVGFLPIPVAVADLDGDRVPDIVTGSTAGSEVSVLLGNGDGSFQAALSFGTGSGLFSISVADLDGDRVLDVVGASPDSDNVSVLLGNGDGSFGSAVPFAVGRSPFSVAVADLDGDSAPDLVVANGSDDNVSVLVNLCDPLARPEIDIRPGSDRSVVNRMSRGLIRVAILGSDSFEVADVDARSLAFGPGGALPVHDGGGHFEDVNGDARTDLVSHYRTAEAALEDGEACVTGATLDGAAFEGCDVVNVRFPGRRAPLLDPQLR